MLRFAEGLGDRHLTRALDPCFYTLENHDTATPEQPLIVSYFVANRVRDNFPAFVASIPARILDGVRDGRLRLVLDNSGEAPQLPPRVLDNWYETFDRFGLDPSRIAYISQGRHQQTQHAEYCKVSGRPRPVKFLYYHWYLKILSLTAEARQLSEADFATLRDRFYRRIPRITFLCLMHKARPERVRLALSIIRNSMWDDALVTFGGLEAELERRMKSRDIHGHGTLPPPIAEDLYNDHPFIGAELRRYMPALMSKGRVRQEIRKATKVPVRVGSPDIVFDLDPTPYLATRFSAVSESEMLSKPHRFTEKSVKPMAHFHPQVTFGNPGVLVELEELGFSARTSLIDDSYDSVPGPSKRFDAAFAQVTRLAKMDDASWTSAYKSDFERLEANARHLFFTLRPKLSLFLDKNLADGLLLWLGGR